MSSVTQSSFEVEDAGKHISNGLRITGMPIGLEKVFDYGLGGHHPVQLGDRSGPGNTQRYKVIHKLGIGGYANVWLCRDMETNSPNFVAMKIIMDEGSSDDCPELRDKLLDLGLDKEVARFFCFPSDEFKINGPNGSHITCVYPVLGPRENIYQVTEAMAAHYSHGVCHGDIRPGNILARISRLDGLSEDEVLRVVGEPNTIEVTTKTKELHNMPSAPQYLVYPLKWDDIESRSSGSVSISHEACVIDFGESFDVNNPPTDIGIPQVYCPPEYTLYRTVDFGSDLWALGCTLFEIRTGRKLFDTFDDDVDECLTKIAMVLGNYPEPWWSTTWETRDQWFKDKADANGRVVEVEHEKIDEDYDMGDVREPRSIREALEERWNGNR